LLNEKSFYILYYLNSWDQGYREMGKYFVIERYFDKKPDNKINDAKRAINKYMEEIKIHFDYNEKEIIEILENVINTRKKRCSYNKWWKIW
jgi:hypothetical protein